MNSVPGPRLRERLRHDAEHGAWYDGARRYLMLRPDSLMGTLRSLDPATRTTVFDALANSLQRHGGDSLRAYAARVNGDPQALIAATIAAACDLGWGQWTVQRDGDALDVIVRQSPFAAGWLAADDGAVEGAAPAVCAPIGGMLAALAQALGDATPQVQELSCAAQGHSECRFRIVAKGGAT
ncbi:MAG: 4-vinyl reductase [Burkholderiaceae bacterium]